MKVGQGILIDCYGNGIVSRHGNQTLEKLDLKNYSQFSRVIDLNINTRFHETTSRITRVHTPQQVQNSMTFP